jgi:hypothetical protein
MFELCIPVNRFLVPETINGECSAYFYVNEDDPEAGGRPIIYSDNNNLPLNRKSMQENFVEMRVNSSKPKGWRSATFKSNGSIASNTYIWFGLYCENYWMPRFDWGSRCYSNWWYEWCDWGVIPNKYPDYSFQWYDDFRLSMYFTYTSAQNYVRTLTQGVKLTDNKKLTGNYKRSATQAVKVNSALKRFETFIRKCAMSVNNTMNIRSLPLFLRKVTEQIKVTMSKNEKMSLARKCIDDVIVNSNTKRIHNVIRNIQGGLKILDTQLFSVLFVRSVDDTAMATGYFRHLGSFIRGLLVTAGSSAETEHTAVYKRKQTDIVQADGAVYRGLLLFVRIVTQVFIRDYLLWRFLKAREELFLKSVICREITLESKID